MWKPCTSRTSSSTSAMSNPDLLSKDEVDALLDNSGDTEDRNPGEIRDYDLASNDRIVRGRLPTLDLINERFARELGTSVFNLLRQTVEVTPAGVKARKYDEFVNSLPVPCSLNLIQFAPLPGTALVTFTPDLIANLVDRFFGGTGSSAGNQQDREITLTEMGIMDLLLHDLLSDMREAWSVLLPVEIAKIGSETNPRFASIANPLDLVLDCTFQIEVEQQTGILHLTFPYAMMEPIRERLENGTQSDRKVEDARWLHALREEIAKARVRLTVAVASTEVAIHELMEMKAGDVIAIDMPEMVTACAEGVPLFRGMFGVHNTKYSIKLCDPIQFYSDSMQPESAAQGGDG